MIKPALKDDAFVADVWAAAADREHLHLWWLGQSGFLVQWQGSHTLIDPYLSDSLTRKYAASDKPHVRMSERVVDPAKLGFIDFVTSSHSHTDHLDAETLRAIQPARLIAPRGAASEVRDRCDADPILTDVGQTVELNEVAITAVAASHAPLHAVGYVLRFATHTIYHSGDSIVFGAMAAGLQPMNIDIAILPINGKLGNMNGREAAQLARSIGAKLVIPCHYDMFEFNTADPNEQFVPECKRIGQPYRVLRLGERFTYP